MLYGCTKFNRYNNLSGLSYPMESLISTITNIICRENLSMKHAYSLLESTIHFTLYKSQFSILSMHNWKGITKWLGPSGKQKFWHAPVALNVSKNAISVVRMPGIGQVIFWVLLSLIYKTSQNINWSSHTIQRYWRWFRCDYGSSFPRGGDTRSGGPVMVF